MIVSNGRHIDNSAPVTIGGPKSPNGSITSLAFVTPSAANFSRQLRMMEENGTIYQIVHRLSESLANAKWGLYRTNGPRVDPNRPRRVVEQHAALRMWNHPNPFYSQQMLMETSAQHLELCGESYWAVAYFDGTSLPAELWPVRPDRMVPVPGGEEFLLGWVYTGPSGEKIPLTNAEVIQVKVPHPRDPYRGLSPILSILSTVESIALSQQWNRNFFSNGAEPGGVIEVPTAVDDTVFKRLQMQWGENHRGVQAAHKVGILEAGMKFSANAIGQKDMQFVEMLNTGREVIREAYGISKTMMGLTEDVNRATAEAAELVFSRYLLEGRLGRYKGVLNQVLLPLFGSTSNGVEFDYDCEVPEDEAAEAAALASRVSAFKTLVDAGVDPVSAAQVCELPEMNMKMMMQTAATVPAEPVVTGGPDGPEMD